MSIETEDDLRYCETDLRETPERRKEALEELQQWLNWDAPSTEVLLRYLRACKYDVNKAKSKMTCMSKLWVAAPEWFSERDPHLPIIKELLELGIFLPILKKDAHNQTVIIIRATSHDPKRHSIHDVFKTGLMTLDLLMDRCPRVAIYGVVALFDMEGVSLSHALQMTTSVVRRIVHSWQNCYPVRIKSLDFFNTPMYIDVVLNVFRRFLNEKLQSRIHVHGSDFTSLHKSISKDMLPIEYKGSCGKLQDLRDYWMETVTNARDWYFSSTSPTTINQ